MARIALLLLAAWNLGAQPAAPKQEAGSGVFDWTALVVRKTATGERRDIIDRPTATFANFESHVTTLEAGIAAHAPHRHADEEVVIVKEGTIEVTINGKTQTVGPGSMLFFASNDLHGMKNVGSGRATYYVIRIVTRPRLP